MENLEKRILELESEVKELRKQLLELALQPRTTYVYPDYSNPYTYIYRYVPITIPPTSYISPTPVITWGTSDNVTTVMTSGNIENIS